MSMMISANYYIYDEYYHHNAYHLPILLCDIFARYVMHIHTLYILLRILTRTGITYSGCVEIGNMLGSSVVLKSEYMQHTVRNATHGLCRN